MLFLIFPAITQAGKPPERPEDWQIVTPIDGIECGITPNYSQSAFQNPATLPDDGTVWRVGSRRWTEADEQDYARWISTEVGTDFLVRFQLRADCADASAILRSVYARIHSLPIYFVGDDQYPNTGSFVKRFSFLRTIRDWNEQNWQENMMKDRRFRAYLAEIPDDIDTRKMPMNAYPIEVYNPEKPDVISPYFLAGTIFAKKDHVKIIHEINPQLWYPFRQYSATTPASAQEFTEYQAELQAPEEPNLGVLRWVWGANCHGRWRHFNPEHMPGYSTQQWDYQTSALHQQNGMDLGWFLDVIGRAPGMATPPVGTVEREVNALENFLRTRVPIVALAQQCMSPDGCPGYTFDDENFGTETFDREVESRYALIEKLVHDFAASMDVSSQDALIRVANTSVIDPKLPSGQTTSLFFFVEAYRSNGISSAHDDPIEKRWGVAANQSLAEQLPSETVPFALAKEPITHEMQWNMAQLQLYEQELAQEQALPSPDPQKIQQLTAERDQYKNWSDYDRTELAQKDADIASIVALENELAARGYHP